MRSSKLLDSPNNKALGIVFMTLFLDLVGFSIIFPLFPAMLEYYLPDGANSTSLLGRCISPLFYWAENNGAADPKFMTSVLFGGVLGSLYSLLQFVCAPLWGSYSDRVGRRKVLIITILGLALSYLAWFFAASFWILVLARLIGGVMGGNLSVATAVVADVTSASKRSSGMALIGIAFGLGFIIGPAIGGISATVNLLDYMPQLSRYGINPFSVPAMISFGLSVINLVWVSVAFKETLPAHKRLINVENKNISIVDRFKSPCRATKQATSTYLFFMLAFSGMEFTLTFLAVERFLFSPINNGMLFVFIGTVMIIVQGGIVRKLSGRGLEKMLAQIGLACGLFAFFGLAYSTSLIYFLTSLICMSFAVALVTPSLSSLVSLYAPESIQGQALGVYRSAGSLARAIGPLVAALAYFSFGSKSAYLFGSVLLVVPLVMAYFLPRPNKYNA
ncbi:MAG TPA: MFS transporter [Opitutae bacterium]|nr:MFS transporter [Opitutae bacterium]